MKPTAICALRTPFAVLSLLYLFTMSLFAQAEPLRVAVMPSFTQNQTYGNVEIGKNLCGIQDEVTTAVA